MARANPKARRSDGVKVVPYDKWGKMLQGRDAKDILDKNGDRIGIIEDEIRYNQVEDVWKVTLADAKRDLNGWLNDKDENGWSYGNEDTSFFVAYADGTQLGDDELDGKKFKQTGIIGIAIQTGDYEMVAGDEWVRRNGKMERVPIQTWSEDGESGLSNVYSGYKSTEAWIERVETTWNNPVQRTGYGGDKYTAYITKRKVIRRSTRRKL